MDAAFVMRRHGVLAGAAVVSLVLAVVAMFLERGDAGGAAVFAVLMVWGSLIVASLHIGGFHETAGALSSHLGLLGLLGTIALAPARFTPAEVPDGTPYEPRLREWRIFSRVGFVSTALLLLLEFT